MRIKTDLLQDMVAKVIQGASNNKLIYMSSLIGIELRDRELVLMTTDGTNNFLVRTNIEEPQQDFYSIVNAEQFSKLVGKTTKEFIELNNNDNYLEVKGNGTYKLPIAINEDGEIIRFSETLIDLGTAVEEINLKELQEAIKTAKASLLKTLEMPMLTGYYIGDNLITTDRQLVCKLDKKFVNSPILLSPEIADLLLIVDDSDKISLQISDTTLLFKTNKYIIYGKELQGKEDYTSGVVSAVTKLTSLEYGNSIQINKKELLDALDRMGLFVEDYDDNGIYLRFSKDNQCLEIQSKKSSGYEKLIPKGANMTENFECLVNIEMLKSQLQSLTSDLVDLYYGQKTSIQLKEGNTTLVIALLNNN